MIDLSVLWMRMALEEARLAYDEDEIPVGAVIVLDGRVIGRGHNRNRALADPTAHAEILAITSACQKVAAPRLDGAHLYVTLEPCAMCAGAIVSAHIARLYYGVADAKAGGCGSIFDIVREPRLNHRVEVYPGVNAELCRDLLASYFTEKRKNNGSGNP